MKLFDKLLKRNKEKEEKLYNSADFYVISYGAWNSTYISEGDMYRYHFNCIDTRIARELKGKERQKYLKANGFYNYGCPVYFLDNRTTRFFELLHGGMIIPLIESNILHQKEGFLTINGIEPLNNYLKDNKAVFRTKEQFIELDGILHNKLFNKKDTEKEKTDTENKNLEV